MLKVGQAGTLESSDIMITVSPCSSGSGVTVELDSIVLGQYGNLIRQTINEVVEKNGVSDIFIKAVDRGALDCTIRARMLTALNRAGIVLKEEV